MFILTVIIKLSNFLRERETLGTFMIDRKEQIVGTI